MPDIAELAPTVEAQRILRRNVRYSNRNGVMAALAANMVSPFLGIYALSLGATNFQIGLMSSLPAFMSLLCAIPGGNLLDRTEHKQRAAFATVAAARAFFVVYALAPMLRETAQAWFLVGVVALTNLPATLSGVAMQSLIAEAFGPRARARALAMRMRLVSLVGVVPLLITGKLLDVIRYPIGYQIMFALAFAVGLVEAYMLLRLVELPPDAQPAPGALGTSIATSRAQGGARAGFRQIIADGDFRHFELAAFVLYFGWAMGGPLFTRYRVTIMGANNAWISVYAVVESLAAVVAVAYWARLGEQRGSRNVLWWCAAGVSGNVWTLAMIIQLPLGMITSAWAGVFNCGTNLLLLNSLLEIAPPEKRATYLAYHATVINVAQLAGPMLSVALMEGIGIRPALVIAGAVRACGGLLFLRSLMLERRYSAPATVARQA